MLRFFAVLAFVTALAASAFAGNITVVSPTEGQYIGATNNITFNITGAVTAVTVKGVLVGPGGTQVSNEAVFTNITDGKINDKLTLNLDTSLPDGAYTLTVTATENGATYNTVPDIHLTVVLKAPKLLDFNPLDKSFVRGTVPISISVQTSYIKDIRVQVDGTDLPNNVGTTTSFTVPWDTTNYPADGSHAITITARDQALNTLTQTINVTLDRIPPVITITYPQAATKILPRSTVTFVIDIADATSQSVSVTGLDVVIKDMSGNFVLRIPRLSFSGSRWIGRVRNNVTLPKQFKLVVDCVDKAGNKATEQTVTYSVG